MAKSKGPQSEKSKLNKIDLDLGYPVKRGGKKETTKRQPPAHGRTAGLYGKIFKKAKKKKAQRKKAGSADASAVRERLETERALGVSRGSKRLEQQKKLKKK